MKKINIPQEENSTLDGQQKVMYAPNDNGKFEKFNYGSDVEEYATKLAVEEYELLMKKSLENIKNNISSPIEYFMYLPKPSLFQESGMFGFVKINAGGRYRMIENEIRSCINSIQFVKAVSIKCSGSIFNTLGFSIDT